MNLPELPKGYGLYKVTFVMSDKEMIAKHKYEAQRRKYGEPPEEVGPDVEYLYADDVQDAAEKAEKKYGRPVKEVTPLEVHK